MELEFCRRDERLRGCLVEFGCSEFYIDVGVMMEVVVLLVQVFQVPLIT